MITKQSEAIQMNAIERILIADGDEGTLRTLSLILGRRGSR
jgi:hypothetical protein